MKFKEDNIPTEEELIQLISDIDYGMFVNLTKRELKIIGFMAEYFLTNHLCIDSEP